MITNIISVLLVILLALILYAYIQNDSINILMEKLAQCELEKLDIRSECKSKTFEKMQKIKFNIYKKKEINNEINDTIGYHTISL